VNDDLDDILPNTITVQHQNVINEAKGLERLLKSNKTLLQALAGHSPGIAKQMQRLCDRVHDLRESEGTLREPKSTVRG
jgi:hypothetical protein